MIIMDFKKNAMKLNSLHKITQH